MKIKEPTELKGALEFGDLGWTIIKNLIKIFLRNRKLKSIKWNGIISIITFR